MVLFLALALVASTPTVLRPSLASPEHSVAVLRPDASSVQPDGWAPRALIRDRDGAVVVRGPTRPVRSLPPELVPVLDADEAIARVTAEGWPGARRAVLVATARGRLAWRIDPPASALGPRNPVFLVDAQTGAVHLRHDRATDAQLRSFTNNPVVDGVAQDFEILDLDPMATDLLGEEIIVFNCIAPEEPAVCGYSNISPTDPEGNFLHPAPNIDVAEDNVQLEDAFAVQSVHHHAETFVAWIRDLGLPGLPCHVQGEPIVLVANYKSYLGEEPLLIGNASYTGDCGLTASFGQGPQADWGYDAEVVHHELSHGVVELMMGEGRRLGLSLRRSDAIIRDAGAMNEGIADFLASVYSDDPVHAEYTSQVGGGTGRRLDNTLTCPRSITGEVHYDGELFGAALWDAHQQLGDALLPVLFDTIALLPENASFEEGSSTMVEVTEQTLGQEAAQTLQAVFEARGLLDCPRVTLWNELERPLWLRPRGQGGPYDPMQPPPVQLAVPLPEDATGFWLRFGLDVLPSAGFSPITEIHAVFGFGQPVEFAYSPRDQGGWTVDASPDLHLPWIDPVATAEGAWVEAPGGQTIYVALFNQSPNVTLLSDFDVEVVIEPAVADTGTSSGSPSDDSSGSSGDGGATGSSGPAAQGDDGCGCRAARPASLPWSLMVLTMLGMVRRRRAMADPTSSPPDA